MSDTCEKVKNMLVLWLAGELDEPEQRMVEAHLAECPVCRSEADELRAFIPELEKALAVEPLTLEPARRNAIRLAVRRRLPWWRLRLGFIAALVIVGLGLVIVALPALSRARAVSPEVKARQQRKAQQLQEEMSRMDMAFATPAAPAAPPVPEVAATGGFAASKAASMKKNEIANDAKISINAAFAADADVTAGAVFEDAVVMAEEAEVTMESATFASGASDAIVEEDVVELGMAVSDGYLPVQSPLEAVPTTVAKEIAAKPVLSIDQLPPMRSTAEEPVSTFGIDTDTASYVMNRTAIQNGDRVNPESVRPEDFVNYLDYHYEAPREGAFQCTLNASRHPFRPENAVLAVGVQGRELGPGADAPSNFAVVVDASGSMALNDRWTPAVQSVQLLQERVGVNGQMATVYVNNLNPTGFQSAQPVRPSGSADLVPGLAAAYQQVQSFEQQPGARNQLLLITDGMLYPDTPAQLELLQLAEAQRSFGVSLNVLGFGDAGNNAFLEKLAEKGGGSFLYVDGPGEVERIFAEQFEARFRPIAEDVKIQVEFNPAVVASYRQVGYDNRQMAAEDFRDDTVRSSPVGSGQAVTALYEMQLTPEARAESLAATVRVRYREPEGFGTREFEQYFSVGDIRENFAETPENFRYAVLMGEWAQSLRFPEAPGVGQAAGILAQLPEPTDGKQREFIQLLYRMR